MKQGHWTDRAQRELDRLGWSRDRLASEIGEPAEKVKKWFTGPVDNPRGDAFEKMAKALEVPAEWLRYGTSTRLVALSAQEKRLIDALRDVPESERPGLIEWFERASIGTKTRVTVDSD